MDDVFKHIFLLVIQIGSDVQKAAEEKFRKIQAAYETSKKERGMN